MSLGWKRWQNALYNRKEKLISLPIGPFAFMNLRATLNPAEGSGCSSNR